MYRNSVATKSAPAEEMLPLPELKFDHLNDKPDLALSREYYQFDAATLATALSRKCNQKSIRDYIQRFERDTVSRALDYSVKGHRVMFYAIDGGDIEIIQLLLEYNANVNSKDVTGVPLLAFAIMRAARVGRTDPEVVGLLLSYGANPLTIPKSMWQNYTKTPTAMVEYAGGAGQELEKWCTNEYRSILAKSLDLTTRYYLWQASRVRKSTKRMLQIAGAHEITALLRLPFQIIGQESTVRLVTETIYAHIAQDARKPLVMAFAGLSGHGKTELAKQMGSLLSIPIITLDCTHLNSQMALLGSTYGYANNPDGAPLNNFLVDNQAKRCVVFLDEFEKTEQGVWNALLKVMDDGSYRDRRGGHDNSELDCRGVIWILATNLGDNTITRFYEQHVPKNKDEDVSKVPIESLQDELERVFMTRFSAAVAGRIDEIVPFSPFNKGEQAVVAHKFLLHMQDEVRRPINEEAKQLIGHATIRVVEDGKVCEEIARKSYKKELGARSINKGVRGLRREFVLRYSDTDIRVNDRMNQGAHEQFVVQLNPVKEGHEELTVFREEADKV